jgi:hypothetical protein
MSYLFMVLLGILLHLIHILMSGIESSNRPLRWSDDYSPTKAPTINEMLITLRTLFYYRKRCVLQTGGVKPYLFETIQFLERVSPACIKNIINLLYNS